MIVAAQKIEASRVTKPIQLLAAWLIGLMLINSSFLAAAISIGGGWERSLLVIAAVLNVPGFLFALFLLQTKFRPELQEDAFYSEYINKKTSSMTEINKVDLIERRVAEINLKIEDRLKYISYNNNDISSSELDWSKWKVGLNVQLPFYGDIKSALNDANIPVTVTFGRNAIGRLDRYTAVINEEMGFDYCIALLRVIVNFPIESFSFWEPLRELGEDEDVYIGNYGENEKKILFTEENRAAISVARDRADLLALRTS